MMDMAVIERDVQRKLFARVGAKETVPEVIFKQGYMGYNTSR